jgi:hypothetical protein
LGKIDTPKFRAAIAAIDEANGRDPNITGGQPAELLYSKRMSAWLARLYPDAGEALQLAARAQHIRRWEIPRGSFEMTRAGYHRWRTRLYGFHADAAEAILRAVGYDDDTIARVRALLLKQNLKTNPDMQALEDVICLVFLESYFADFAPKHDEEKVITILRRTWKKMSDHGHAAALALPMEPKARELVEKALKGP